RAWRYQGCPPRFGHLAVITFSLTNPDLCDSKRARCTIRVAALPSRFGNGFRTSIVRLLTPVPAVGVRRLTAAICCIIVADILLLRRCYRLFGRCYLPPLSAQRVSSYSK